MRLLRGADLAIDYLLNLLEPKPPCDKCGRSDVDRDPVVVRACQLVLDRSGFGPSANLNVHSAPPVERDPVMAYLTTEELTTIDDMFMRAERRMHEAEGTLPVIDISADGVDVDE